MSGYVLRLHSPHDAAVQAFRAWKKNGGDMHWRLRQRLENIGYYRSLTKEYLAPPAPWVCEIRNGKRVFLRGKGEYPERFGNSDDDVWYSFVLEPGKRYEINQVIPQKLTRKGFLRVTVDRYEAKIVDGQLERIDG